MRIVIVDYGMGNLRSVYNALISLGGDAKIISTPSEIKKADKLILPGVGSLGDAIKGLEDKNLVDPIKEFIESGRIYLGLCLGLQILFEKSEEGNVDGFGILKGRVRRFKEKKGIKIPHMGWNQVKLTKGGDSSLHDTMQDNENCPHRLLKDGEYFYFVHSYYAEPKDKNVIFATTEYGGIEFTSMVYKDNIYATQFHPEKSQSVGLKFLKNFLEL